MATSPTPRSLQSDRLDLFYQLSQTFNSTLDLDEVLDRVIDEVIRVMGAERGFLMLVGEGEEFEFMTARGLDRSTIQEPAFQISRGIVDEVALEGIPLLTSDAAQDQRFKDRQSVFSLGLRSILCVPLKTRDRLDGVIYVDNRLVAGIFTEQDLNLLSAIAASAAIAIENARLYKVAVDKGRMERELQMAYQVQQSLLPRQLPSIPGWQFDARWKPALEVAGDYYDLISAVEGKLYLVIGDVTDKGMPASLFMVFTRSAVRASIEVESSLVAAMNRSNRLLSLESDQGLFVTLFIACLDLESGALEYVNAGHNPPLYLRSGAGEFEALRRTGVPLGIDRDYVYEANSICLDPGDLLVLYTDGISEAVNSLEEQFGMERLEAAILRGVEAPVVSLADQVIESVEGYSDLSKSSDDITLLVVRRDIA